MASCNFYLKKAEVKSGLSLIYLQFTYSGYKVIFSFGETIKPFVSTKKPGDWNYEKQRPISSRQEVADGDYYLSDRLDDLERVCRDTYQQEKENGVPDPAAIKIALSNFITKKSIGGDSSLYDLIDRFIANEIKFRGMGKKPSTLKSYKTTKNHLLDFEKAMKQKVNFKNIDLSFYYAFTSYLESTIDNKKALKKNSIGKDIKNLKVFMSEAVDMNLTSNTEFKKKKFAKPSEQTDAVYLTNSEIETLYQYDFNQNKKLEQVRDLFIFACSVGLRFSDFSTIKKENLVEIEGVQYISKITDKTSDPVTIPCNPIVLQILKKYSLSANSLPKAISNQKFNEYIQLACKAAGMTQQGRLKTDLSKKLWECVSSHTARRSFCCSR